jgi:hypothetical protein
MLQLIDYHNSGGIMAAIQHCIHDIPSIRDKHPNLPAILCDIDINRRIQANTPIDHATLIHAESVAKVLKGRKGMVLICIIIILLTNTSSIEIGDEPLITDIVVKSAELRARAVEAVRASFHSINFL